MRLEEVAGGKVATLRLRPSDTPWSAAPAIGDELSLSWSRERALLRLESEAVALEGVEGSDHRALEGVMRRGLPILASVIRSLSNHIVVECRTFPRQLVLSEPVDIGVDDHVVDVLRSVFKVGGTVADVADWLHERICLPPAPGAPVNHNRLVVAAGRDDRLGDFRIFGHRLAVDVARIGEHLRVERVVRGGRAGKRRLTLLHAPVHLTDATRAAAITGAVRTALDEAVADGSSYMRIWQEYHALEEAQVLEQARALGTLAYIDRSRQRDGGWQFRLAPPETEGDEAFNLGDWMDTEIEATERPPMSEGPSSSEGRVYTGRVRSVGERPMFLECAPQMPDEDLPAPPKCGYLFVSIRGDAVRLDRRRRAEEALRTGNCHLPQLGLLLEGKPAPAVRMPRRGPLSPAVREIFGNGRPTERQVRAIERALNTPDICLIQGPPGTGKTKVITALERRLAELADDGNERSHRILVTAAQHDAVENVAQRTDVFGLPAAKIGRRRGEAAVIDPAQAFADDRVDALRARSPLPSSAERLMRARTLAIAACRLSGTPAEQAGRLRDVVRTLGDLLDPRIADRAQTKAAALSRPRGAGAAEDQERDLRAARGIRVNPLAFSDDGPVKALKALRRLDKILEPDERAFLERCTQVEAEPAPPWLAEGCALRDRLIDRLTPQPISLNDVVDAETRALLMEVLDDVERRLADAEHGEDAAVAGFVHDLEHDLAAVRAAIEHYTMVLAATLQQSAGRRMRQALDVRVGSAEFESVIIDEAARANPLDLFIPLSMARRRVVLVGDHRQLPHLLEPNVERTLRGLVDEGTVQQQTLEAIRSSLFARLWVILRRLEALDGIPRTVTLDAQYRMHPVLGRYISEVFYEAKGDGPISSPRPADDFAHDLPGYLRGDAPCPAAWLDVPAKLGGERRDASKSRLAEARSIAREVRRLIDHDPSLTFGVIAFYRAQVDMIGKAMIDEGLADAIEDPPGWRIADRWARTRDRDNRYVERLRVGTVDAFQGKEFDVVFLSVTRSNDLPDNTESERRRKYGHLMLDNRLCVAMSRQKRLLVVAGDRAFVRDAKPLGALRAYLDLCGGAHGVVR